MIPCQRCIGGQMLRVHYDPDGIQYRCANCGHPAAPPEEPLAYVPSAEAWFSGRAGKRRTNTGRGNPFTTGLPYP